MNTCKLTEFFSSDYHLFGVHLHPYFLEKLPSSKAASMSTSWLKQQQTNKQTIQITNLSTAKIVFDSVCRLSLCTFWIHTWFKKQCEHSGQKWKVYHIFQICWYHQQNIYPQFICRRFIEIPTGKHISVLSSICFEHKLGLTVWLPLNHRYHSSLCDFGCFTWAAIQNPKHNVENPRICSKSEPTSGLWLIRSLECQLSIPQAGPTHIVVIAGIPTRNNWYS